MPIEVQRVLDIVRMWTRLSHPFPLGDYGRGASLSKMLAANGDMTSGRNYGVSSRFVAVARQRDKVIRLESPWLTIVGRVMNAPKANMWGLEDRMSEPAAANMSQEINWRPVDVHRVLIRPRRLPSIL